MYTWGCRVRTYVYMYVCMYLCIHVCMYVCIRGGGTCVFENRPVSRSRSPSGGTRERKAWFAKEFRRRSLFSIEGSRSGGLSFGTFTEAEEYRATNRRTASFSEEEERTRESTVETDASFFARAPARTTSYAHVRFKGIG